MFSNRIANSAKFLQMPSESQLLYFHMIIRADDDGVVETYPLMKLLGVAPDNLKILRGKEFIKEINQDQVVVITDWLEHNKIRADRKVDSIYKHLLIAKVPEIKLIEAKPRSDVEDNSQRIGGQSTDGLGKVRIGKVKLSKDSKRGEDATRAQEPQEKKPTPSEIARDFFAGGPKYTEIMNAFAVKAPREFLEREFKKFLAYWSEPNKSGTKVRWEQQSTFEIKLRLVTWLNRSMSDKLAPARGKGKEIIY